MTQKNSRVGDLNDNDIHKRIITSDEDTEPTGSTRKQKKTKPGTYRPEGEIERKRIRLFKHYGGENGDSKPNKVERNMDVETLAGTMTNIKVEASDLAFFDRFVCYATARTNSDINIFVCNSN